MKKSKSTLKEGKGHIKCVILSDFKAVLLTSIKDVKAPAAYDGSQVK